VVLRYCGILTLEQSVHRRNIVIHDCVQHYATLLGPGDAEMYYDTVGVPVGIGGLALC